MSTTERIRWSRVALMAATAVTLLVVPVDTATSPQNAARETRDRHVLLTVLDKNDAPVMDLTVADVVVREDGVAREISHVGRATSPMQIVLLADDSQAAMSMPAELQKGLTSFVRTVLTASPDTEIQLMTFGERPTTQQAFTTSVSLLTQASTRVFPHSGAGAYFLEAITDATKALTKKEASRPIIVGFVVEDGPEFSNEDRQIIEKTLKNANVPLWTIALQGRQTGSTAQRERSAVISDVASASGGGLKTILDKQGLERAFGAIATLLTSQIDVTYARPDRLVPPSKLEVTVKRPDLRVWAPRWTGSTR